MSCDATTTSTVDILQTTKTTEILIDSHHDDQRKEREELCVFIKKNSVRQAAYFTVVANGLAVSEGGVMPHPLLNHALSS